ncbi:MAG: DUF4111 domain-containing protein [bacterium]|nr:DUF4111 domain-containing protein [bacterium]
MIKTHNDQAQISPAIKILLDDIADKIEKLLGDNFVGLYVHGSIAMNCFNPLISDIDFLIVIREKIGVREKRNLAQILLDAKCDAKKGVETSVVLLKYTKNPVFPTPFEFHFSKGWEEKYRRNEVDYSKESFDPDLGAHFTVTKKRGFVWRGLPISKVFSDVPKEFYKKSLLYDFNDLDKNIFANPVYGILNACRTVAYLKDEIVLSKKEGGEWALENLDIQYCPIVRQALLSYETGEKFSELNKHTTDSFVHYLKSLVKRFS